MPSPESNPPAPTGALLQDRHAVITGGSRGLGRAIADRFAQEGAEITVIDTAGALANADLPGAWRSSACDFLADGAEAKMAGIARGLNAVDIVVANAGLVPPWRRIAELDLAEWDRVFRVNVTGVAMTLKCFAPLLARSDHGAAVVMASLNARTAHPRQGLYTATKHAVLGLARAAALDLGPEGVRVNAIGPGPIATDALLSRLDTRHAVGGPDRNTALAELAADTALGRIATPQDVAGVALYLASDLSHGVTGTLQHVDCGLT